MKTLGIIGYGEVGKAIEVLSQNNYQVYKRDLNFDEISGNTIDLLHVCIPFNEKFVDLVVSLIQEIKPKSIIIDSTIKPGTTRAVYEACRVPIAHCPIMGVHPHLADYQQEFTKVIGAIDDESYQMALEYWQSVGVNKTARFDRPEEAEIAKLLCTTYYGWNIIYNKMVHRLCEQNDYNFDQVYTQFNDVYNQGYEKTLPHVRRPNLKYVPGTIGGHCVIPNLKILEKAFQEPTFSAMLELNETLSKD